MDRVLFLGSNSFSGRHFKDFINRNDLYPEFSFTGTDKEDADNCVYGRIGYLKMNPLDESELEHVLVSEKPDYIINFIGIFYGASYAEYFNVNVNVSRNIFESIIKNKLDVKKVLLVGSAAEYGEADELPIKEDSMTNPVSLYGISKLMQTHIARFYFNNYGINVNVARTFNIIGKGISNNLSVGNFIESINSANEGDTISTGNLKAKRDYLHIDDVIEAYWHILIKGRSGEVYNVCSANSLSMKEIFSRLVEGSGKVLSVKSDERFAKNNDIPEIYGDNSKLRNHTGWYPRKDIFSAGFIQQLVGTGGNKSVAK